MEIIKETQIKYSIPLTEKVLKSIISERYDVPESSINIRASVPGGGDWSNMDIDFDNLEVTVTWEVR